MRKLTPMSTTDRVYFELHRLKKDIEALIKILDADRPLNQRNNEKVVLFDSVKGRSFCIKER